MKEQFPTVETLLGEITRYLAAVELFRTERCEPTWRPELMPHPAPDERIALERTRISRAH
jgi:hypothetical protein